MLQTATQRISSLNALFRAVDVTPPSFLGRRAKSTDVRRRRRRRSSDDVCVLTDKSGLLTADICSCQDCGDASVKLASSVPDFSKLSTGVKNSKNIEKNKTDDFSGKTFPQTLQIPQTPQFQHQASRLAAPVSPKARTKSEASADSSRKSSLPLLSPVSPSRKYFKKIPSPVLSAGNRRGSEPALMSSLQQAQLNVTDRRWEKLRAILVAMKNKPFDVDTCLKLSSSELLNSLQEKINANNENIAIQGELLYLQDALKKKELDLQQAEAERDSALAYIRHLKANLSDAGEQTMQLYKQGIESLKTSSVSKLNVTDRRWEKLRAILVAMKNKPFDVDACLKSSSSELLNSLQEKINANNEKIAIQGELLYLQDALKKKELDLQQAEAERDSALAYIRHLKANLSDAGEQTMQLYKQGIESLKTSSVSKENVIDIVTSLVKELEEQKSYLDCLMTVVLMRAPWMLDEVDKMELPKNQELGSPRDDFDEENDFQFEDSDNEV